MKIKVINTNSKQPVANTKIQLQVKGKDSGYLSLTSDASGFITLDDKYNGQQITSPMGGGQPQWVAAQEGATVYVAVGAKTTATAPHGSSSK